MYGTAPIFDADDLTAWTARIIGDCPFDQWSDPESFLTDRLAECRTRTMSQNAAHAGGLTLKRFNAARSAVRPTARLAVDRLRRGDRIGARTAIAGSLMRSLRDAAATR